MNKNKLKTAITGLILATAMSSSAFAATIQLDNNDRYLPQVAQDKILALKSEWEDASSDKDTQNMSDLHTQADTVRSQYVNIYQAADGSTFTYDDVVRVASLIKHEAAPNDVDRFMVGATFVDRWHAGLRGDSVARYWGNTTASVLGASGQYYNEYRDSKHLKFVNDANSYAFTKENNRFMYIAFCCLSGDFSIPYNVYGQSASKQGTLYMYVNNKYLSGNSGYFNHQYCVMPSKTALASTDWAGRPAMPANDAVNLIYQLAGQFVG